MAESAVIKNKSQLFDKNWKHVDTQTLFPWLDLNAIKMGGGRCRRGSCHRKTPNCCIFDIIGCLQEHCVCLRCACILEEHFKDIKTKCPFCPTAEIHCDEFISSDEEEDKKEEEAALALIDEMSSPDEEEEEPEIKKAKKDDEKLTKQKKIACPLCKTVDYAKLWLATPCSHVMCAHCIRVVCPYPTCGKEIEKLEAII